MALYVAYGSNIHRGQMAYRCPTAVPYAKGFIKDYRLVFNTHADIIPEIGCEVPVLVWDITSDTEWATLDRYEGVKGGYYERQTVRVEMECGEEVDAIVYVMCKQRKGFMLPYRQYWDGIVEGYEWQGMDKGYLYEALDYTDLKARVAIGEEQ